MLKFEKNREKVESYSQKKQSIIQKIWKERNLDSSVPDKTSSLFLLSFHCGWNKGIDKFNIL